MHLLARHVEVERAERDVLADRRHEELVVGILEDEPDRARADRATSPSPTRMPATSSSPSPVSSPLRCSISVVLPAPFGPEHGDALAVRDVEVDAVEPDDAVRVAEAHAVRVDRAAHPATTRSGISVSAKVARNAVSARRKASTASRGIAPAYPRASIAR